MGEEIIICLEDLREDLREEIKKMGTNRGTAVKYLFGGNYMSGKTGNLISISGKGNIKKIMLSGFNEYNNGNLVIDGESLVIGSLKRESLENSWLKLENLDFNHSVKVDVTSHSNSVNLCAIVFYTLAE